MALNLFRQLVVYLSPVVPSLARQTEELLGDKIVHWDQSQTPLVGTPVAKFKRMLDRVEKKDVAAMMEDSKEEEAGTTLGGDAGPRILPNHWPPNHWPKRSRSTTSSKSISHGAGFVRRGCASR